jgi:hypothetical protein
MSCQRGFWSGGLAPQLVFRDAVRINVCVAVAERGRSAAATRRDPFLQLDDLEAALPLGLTG